MPPAPERAAPPAKRPVVVRDADAWRHGEYFIVCAIATLLLIRAFLAATGYPRLGGGGLHIAHMLWGGLALSAALLLTLSTLNRRVRPIAAGLGGIGFGFFIDELGKFITSDNDYFYQPTLALIYFVFVALYLTLRWSLSSRPLAQDENLANAMALMQEMTFGDLDRDEKERAAQLLARCDPSDPRGGMLRDLLRGLAEVPAPPPGPYARLKGGLRRHAVRFLERPLFARLLALYMVGQALVALTRVGLTTAALWASWRAPAGRHLEQGFAGWGQLATSLAAGACVVVGAVRLRRSRLRAWRTYRLALLVSLFGTQFFVFYDAQLAGVLGLALNLALLASVEYLITLERRRMAAAR